LFGDQDADSDCSSAVSTDHKRRHRPRKQRTPKSEAGSHPPTPVSADSPVAEDTLLPVATSSPAVAVSLDETPTSTTPVSTTSSRARKNGDKNKVRYFAVFQFISANAYGFVFRLSS